MTVSDYKEVINNLKRYNSGQEKEALLYLMEDDITALKTAQILGANPKNEFEALAFIFKLREISVSDLIDLTYTCVNKDCKYQDALHISIPDMFWKDDELDEAVPIGLFQDLDSIEEDIKDINILSIMDYNVLENKIFSNNYKIFDPKIDIVCKRCNTANSTTISFKSIVSKFSISNIYEQYFDVSYFCNMTKIDTDSMFPFEREIFIGLIQAKQDEIEKANKR